MKALAIFSQWGIMAFMYSIAAMIGLIIYSRREQQQILHKAKREVQREAQQKK